MDPLFVSIVASAISVFALGVTLSRRRNHVVDGLRSELDLALAENKRLADELRSLDVKLHHATVKAGDVLERIAKQAVLAAEQTGADGPMKKRAAMVLARKLDEGDNGRRDFSDAQLSIAIEALLRADASASTR